MSILGFLARNQPIDSYTDYSKQFVVEIAMIAVKVSIYS